MSEVVGFKLNSGAATVNFNAISVTPSFLTEESRYTLLDFTRKREIHGKWKRWTMTFSLLEEADQDYLLQLAAEAEPQMILQSTTYNIEIFSTNTNFRSGAIDVVNRTPES